MISRMTEVQKRSKISRMQSIHVEVLIVPILACNSCFDIELSISVLYIYAEFHEKLLFYYIIFICDISIFHYPSLTLYRDFKFVI